MLSSTVIIPELLGKLKRRGHRNVQALDPERRAVER